MLPTNSPQRLVRAQASLSTIYEFLNRYDQWKASADDSQCDFALGNPQAMPLAGFVNALQDAATPENKDWYAYKSNELESQEIVRNTLKTVTGRTYDRQDVLMTNGATGALLVTMNSIIETGDEVIYNSPPWFFYEGMILNQGGVPVAVKVDETTSDLDLDGIERAITSKTRMVLVNSPNNPTGKVYKAGKLKQLAELLVRASAKHGHTIYLLSDEVYRSVVYDEAVFVSPTNFYPDSIMVYSYGKTLLTPGQRVGYIALSPEMEGREELRTAMATSQILCGWATTSALMQHALSKLETLALDITELQKRRDQLLKGLRSIGFEVSTPEGAFYVTPKSPIEDDNRFAAALAEHNVLCLPGNVVQMPGHVRMSFTANREMIERALPIMETVRRQFE